MRPKNRQDALNRLAAATYEKSKAKRLGTKTKAQWEEWRSKEMDKLILKN